MNEPVDWLLGSSPWVQHRARLDLLGQTDRSREVKAARQAMLDHPQVQALPQSWQERKAQRPYLFAMGADFAKLKAPSIWYDILHVGEVLTQFAWLRQDRRLREMVALVEAKADNAGRFTLESIWLAWREWDFGQKREPSAWLTLLAWRMLRRRRCE